MFHLRLCMMTFSNLSFIIRYKFPILIIQKFVGSASLKISNEKRPSLLRCIVSDLEEPIVYFIKRLKQTKIQKLEEEKIISSPRKGVRRQSSQFFNMQNLRSSESNIY